jgi:predicted dehydrogenase
VCGARAGLGRVGLSLKRRYARTVTIGVGIIGFGFMGKAHAAAYEAAATSGFDCRVVAVADPRGKESTTDAAAVRDTTVYTSAERLLADERVRLVSICTYTDTHAPLAAAALKAGKHVLVEKPVSLESETVRALRDEAAAHQGLVCIPAMCMRFWPGWDWLAATIKDGSLGAVRSATFTRLSAGPAWGGAFYNDHARSGGALVDLHIHDADFVLHAFGEPGAVSSAGGTTHVTTLYHFENGPSHVAAEGAWDLAPAAGFRMRFLVNFERGTAEFDLSRTPSLVLHTAAGTQPVPLESGTGYDGEVRHVLNVIAEKEKPRATLDDALAVTRILEAERTSLEQGGRLITLARAAGD